MNNEQRHALRRITRLHLAISNSLFMTVGALDYQRITEAVRRLAVAVDDFDAGGCDDAADELWSVGEFGYSGGLSEFIVGAFWHYTEWHAGQSSPEYAALSALGLVFNPGCTYPERDNETYIALNTMAQE